MVNRSYYQGGEDMPALRRYSSRGPAFPLSHDREPGLSHDIYQSRPQQMSSHDRSSDRHSPDSDLSSRPRSRIPVACGRCRKRKIKCSGDTGNGASCTNCKTAQHDQCQFLRVSSHETPIKSEASSYGDYEVSNSGAASRMNSRIPMYGPQYVLHSPLPVESSYPSFRSNSLSAYPLPSRTYYPIPQFNEYADGETIEYDVHPSYQAYGSDNLAMPANFAPSGAPRGWNSAPQVARNSLFLEQSETPYNHGQTAFHGNSFPLRTHGNSESRSLSLNGIATNLPAPLTTDRMLPIPATHRQMTVVAPYHRSSEGVLPASQTQNGWSNYQGDYSRNTLKSQNMQSISENGSIASSYLPMASSSPESIASSQITFNSQQMSMGQQQQHQQGDMFTPPGTDSMYATESSDSSYGHSSSTGSKRGSHSSQASHADPSPLSSLPPIATDALTNGQRYVPYQSNNYPTPFPAAPPLNNLQQNLPPNVSAHQASILIE